MALNSPAVRRSSLPLTLADDEDLDLVRSSPEHRAALERLTGTALPTGSVSEAALLHAIWRAGVSATRSAVEEAGYAAMAAQLADADTQARQSQARRRRPVWADEP